MSEAPGPEYHPLWLTAEEHQALFGELLAEPEGFKAERVAELLKRADARAPDATVGLSLGDNSMRFSATSRRALPMAPSGVSSARRAFAVMLLGTVILLAIAITLHLVTRR
jgi:hypothetical protein